MTSREKIWRIINGEKTDTCGLWLGNPDPASWPIWHGYFGTSSEEELRQKLGDDFRWICPEWFSDHNKDPQNQFVIHLDKRDGPGKFPPLANCETLEQLDNFHWPIAEGLCFDSCLKALDCVGDLYRASGMWTPFYHIMQELFGMEEYFIKIHTNPEVVQAATDRVCQFYYDANEIFFTAAKGKVDAFFFGNDFGTQLDLICSPTQFDEFIMPWFCRFIDQGHCHGLQVILHSCGAIHKVIGRLIDANVNCLHPIQAKARNMQAETLAKDFGGKISFMGGIDTQDLLVNAKPDEVRADVLRVRAALEPRLIVSPSHEAVLPNVQPANIEAMANASWE